MVIHREHRGLKPLIRLINTNGPDLLTNVSLSLGRCAEDHEALKYIRHLDGKIQLTCAYLCSRNYSIINPRSHLIYMKLRV